MSHLTDDQLIDVSHDLLDEKARAPLLLHLQSCGECEARFRQVAGRREALRSSEQPRVQGEDVVLAGTRRTGAHRARGRPGLLIAASLTAAVLAGWLWWPTPEAALPEHWLPREPIDRELRSASSEDASSFLQMLDAYDRRDIDEALGILGGLNVSDDDALRTLGRIYQADLLLRRSGEGGEALRLLDSVKVDTVPLPWRWEARWIRYAALRLDGRTDEADAALDELQHAPGKLGELARDERARISDGSSRHRR